MKLILFLLFFALSIISGYKLATAGVSTLWALGLFVGLLFTLILGISMAQSGGSAEGVSVVPDRNDEASIFGPELDAYVDDEWSDEDQDRTPTQELPEFSGPPMSTEIDDRG